VCSVAVYLHHGLSPQQHADDTHIYGSCSLIDIHAFSQKVSEYVNDIASWMRCNRLQLNPGKTELLRCSTDRCRHRLSTSALTIGSTSVLSVSTVHGLGISVGCDLVMRTCVPHCLVLLRHAASVAQHPLPCLCVSLPVARH